VTWRTFEHQADVGIQIDAPTGEALFAEAGIALYSLVCDLDTVEERERYELRGEAQDVGELLVAWLNDLIFLFEGSGVVCRRFAFTGWSVTEYRANAFGEPADPERHGLRDVVKAATYHGLSVVSGESGWVARVILDI
jgi:SHS2 domain-containing protein